jgi:hypothetical protein
MAFCLIRMDWALIVWYIFLVSEIRPSSKGYPQLEFKVVTPTGLYLTANAYQNQGERRRLLAHFRLNIDQHDQIYSSL